MARKSSRALWTAQLLKAPPSRQKAPAVLRGTSGPIEGFILGIDPSLRGTGLAVIHSLPKQHPQFIHSETIHNKASLDFCGCLGHLFERVHFILQKWPIQEVSVEQTIYVQNFQTAQILGAARGALIAAAAIKRCNVVEYPPLRIKQAIVGFGRAGKEQVARTLMQMFQLPSQLPLDESDALAAALCHFYTYSTFRSRLSITGSA